MSFSKNIKHCRRCIRITSRHYQTDSSGTAEATPKMTTKVMSLTQWKVFNQLKEYYNKYSTDKNFQQLFNKELASILQKFQPSVYGNDIIRTIETTSAKKTTEEPVKEVVELQTAEQEKPKPEVASTKEQGYRILTGFKLKMAKSDSVPEKIQPKWKSHKTAVSKCSVTSRTFHVISMINSAESDSSKLRRIEDLTAHIQQYPEAKHHAFKEGVVRLLLRIREQTANPEIVATVKEAFGVLGYMDPLPSRGIRILSIDGGGTRGLLVIAMLKKLEELTGTRVHEMFDMICGVSTGAIISCGLGASQKDLNELQRYYKELSIKIFSQNAFWGTSSLVWSHSYYDTKVWEQILKEFYGETELIKTSRHEISPKVIAVSAVVNQARASVVRPQYMGGTNHKIWEAVRASAAAPTYFEEFKLGNLLHQDGGIMVNNPTAVAIHEARQLWPNTPIQCVVSFGTGRSNHVEPELTVTGTSSSWKNKFLKILDSATDTESVHMMLNDLLPPNTYYRFNPYLTEMLDMSEIRSDKLDQLERDAMMYLRKNDDKFHAAAKTLLAQRTTAQKALDWLTMKREIMGANLVK
ncbi:calcium-independent phospholipase A2 VIA [Carabus blaptoides fortunei]